ncbi:MAG: hypothetical protein KDN19_12590 [Verrucomicrobiae bacterium]|nr:hypothetical protein [Verrucomicrobiae bacterium]
MLSPSSLHPAKKWFIACETSVNKLFVVGAFLFTISIAPLAWAHSPHDHIEAFDLGPSRENPDTEVMLIVVRGNLWRSIDHGARWKRIVRGIDARWELNSLAVAPTKRGPVWYLGTDGDGVYRSTDDGWSWEKMTDGLVERKVRGLAASSERVILATTDARIYVAAPGDTNWHQVREHESKVTSVWVGDTGTLVFGDEKGHFFESGDGGQTWNEIFHRPDPAGATAYHRGPSGQVLLGFGTAGIFDKPDADGEFAEKNQGITDQRIVNFASLPAPDSPLYAVTWNDGVFRSTDNGAHWIRGAEGLTTDKQGDRRGLPQFTVLRPSALDGSLFLAGYDGLFHSTDHGATWTEIETLPQNLLIDFDISPDFANDHELVAITYWKGAARSRDAGATWEPINQGLTPTFWTQAKRLRDGNNEYAQIQRFHSITYSPCYAADRTIFAGMRNWFLYSNDRGDSWNQVELTQFAEGEDVIPDRVRFSNEFASDGTILFCCRYGEGKTRAGSVFRSTDRGRTWKETLRTEGKYMQSLALSPDFAEDGTGFTSSARGGDNSLVFRTTDGGLTWTDITGDLQFTDYGAELAVSPDFTTNHTVWAGTEKGLWRSKDAGDTWERQKTGAFSEDAFIDLIALSPVGHQNRRIIVTAKGEGMFESTDGGDTFHPWREEIFAGNHQFNRLWSYSPGKLVKFAPEGDTDTELFAVSGEGFYRLSPGEMHELPLRQTVRLLGTVDLKHWWGAVISLIVAGIGAVGVIVSFVLRLRARRQRLAANRV